MPDYQAMNEENISQQPALDLLQSMGYEYIPYHKAKEMRGKLSHVILKDILIEQLRKINSYEYKGQNYQFSEKNIQQAVADLDEPLANGLLKANEEIYNSLTLGRSYQEVLPDQTRRSFILYFIDWDNPANNVYHVTEEYAVEREDGYGNLKPDIVLFVNGIPLAVIECKRSSISADEGIKQIIGYQNKDAIPHLFKYTQILMATNKDQSMYATCGSPKEFWMVWREEFAEWLEEKLARYIKGRTPTEQDKTIISLFSPERLLELAAYFTLFENNDKIIARYQQYFAVKKVMQTVKTYDEQGRRQGGVIWHTQGSGKSLTMVMLAKSLMADPDINNPRVILVTDRVNLDRQIRNTFTNTSMQPAQATSGQKLVELIEEGSADIITTLVHKFETASRKKARVEDKNIFVMVDESHRTQYGELHNKMRQVFPYACYLGFTGTPLMKKEKNTMFKFGLPEPLHTYNIADGVKDKAIVPLLYEGKMVDQTVNQKAIDNKLEMITRHLNDKQKEEVKQKWSRFERIASSLQRIEYIAFDINEHFLRNYKTQGSHFKAMLATSSKREAIKYLQAFEELGDLEVAVVISPPQEQEGQDEPDGESKEEVNKFWQRMMRKYGNEKNYEEAIKDDFVNGDLDMVIVVDKLLTGFDAPRATVLYIDKPLKEHSLLQAIARVNRIYEGKDYGYIVDYRGLLQKLDEAMNMYAGGGLENYDPEDLKGVMYDVKTVIGKLREAYAQLFDLFIYVENKNDPEEYAVRLENDELREKFYEILSKFSRNLSIALQSEEVYSELEDEELERYKRELKFFQELRKSVKLRYSDSIDHKEYETKMQKLMDNYISSEEVIRVTKPVDILDEKGFEEELSRLNTPRAKADAIRTRMTQRIEKKWDEDPAFYKKFSRQIEETLQEYRDNRISEAEYLERMHKIKQDFQKGDTGFSYPEPVQGKKHAQAFYGVVKDVVEEDKAAEQRVDDYEILADIALEIEKIVERNAKVDWHENPEVHRAIEQEIDDLLYDYSQKGLELPMEQIDKIIENVKTVALRRY